MPQRAERFVSLKRSLVDNVVDLIDFDSRRVLLAIRERDARPRGPSRWFSFFEARLPVWSVAIARRARHVH